MKRLYLDFETQSAVNLRTVGSKTYIHHPSTRIMSGVFMEEDGQTTVWVPQSRLPKFGVLHQIPGVVYIHTEKPPVELFNSRTLVAHNAELFDQRLFETLYPLTPQCQWLDTMHLARANGYPAGLDGLLKALGMPGKSDPIAMMTLTTAKVAGGRYVYVTGTMPLWEKLIRYNIDDVKMLGSIATMLESHNNFDAEITAINVDINREGFKLDATRLIALRNAWERAIATSGDEVSRITGGELNAVSIRSHTQVKAWLIGKGFSLRNNSLSKGNLAEVLAQPEKFTTGLDEFDGLAVIALLAERQNSVSAIVGKLKRMQDEMLPDGRVTHCYVQDGAHTGRSSAKVVQPHNFARGVEIKQGFDELLLGDWSYDAICQTSKLNGLKVRDVLATLTRSVICPTKSGNTFTIYDYSKIEAVLVAWFANCKPLLRLYADPHADVYCDMGSKLYGRIITPKDKQERFVGKQIILACGYQMSAAKFDLSCRSYGIDLADIGVTPQECVTAFRTGYPEIPALWKGLNNSTFDTVRTGIGRTYAKCQFAYVDGWLEVTLPSGRRLRYRDTKIVMRENPWRFGEEMEQVEYTNGYGIPKYLYGGILAENIVQATANDLLRDAKKRCHTAATPIRVEVHDELVFESSKLAALGKAMSTPPVWGHGIPLMVEGFTSPVYTKYSLKSSKKARYMLGKLV